MTRTGSDGLKKAVRARMAESGENYTRALAAIQRERQTGSREVPLTLGGIGGPVIGTATVAEDGTLTAVVTDPDAAAALSTPISALSVGTAPQRERLVHENPEPAAQIREGVAEAERGESVDLGSFAQHLSEGGG